MKKIILTLTVAVFLLVAGCSKNDNVNEPKPEPSNSLVGVWYTFPSTEDYGVKVIFTDSTVTAFEYIINHPSIESGEWRWYNNTPYLFENDTIWILTAPEPEFVWACVPIPMPTKIKIHSKNTVTIQYFIPNNFDGGWPSNYSRADLYRSYDNE
jgi:hypothetical protein